LLAQIFSAKDYLQKDVIRCSFGGTDGKALLASWLYLERKISLVVHSDWLLQKFSQTEKLKHKDFC